jgi:poly-gamma-glutamate capsule biosynthesis protein CapA/YwtB (metallophosphatase superfamily)
MAVGDVMLARTIGQRIKESGAGAPWAAVAATLAQADLVVANLECAISAGGRAADKGFTFRAPLSAADSLSEAGIGAVSMANNHALDYGVVALEDTMAALETRSIVHFGAGEDARQAREPAIVERNGLRVAFLGYVAPITEPAGFSTRRWAAGADEPGLALATVADVERDVADAATAADVVVVFFHSGREFARSPIASQRRLAHAAIDAGAALVVSAHPHVLQGYERGNGTLIAYSLGNFVFDGYDGASNDSAILDVSLSRAGVTGFTWAPVVVADGFPQLATGEDAERIRRRLDDLTP